MITSTSLHNVRFRTPAPASDLARPVPPGNALSLEVFRIFTIVKMFNTMLMIPSYLPRQINPFASAQQQPTPIFPYELMDDLLIFVLLSEASSRVLGCMIIILDRLQDKPSILTRGLPKRGLLLAVFIVALNYITGTRRSYTTWSAYYDGFGPSDIASMEIEVISLLDYDIRITDLALRRRIDSLISTSKANPPQELAAIIFGACGSNPPHQHSGAIRAPSVPVPPPVPTNVPCPRRRAQSAPSRFTKYQLEWETSRPESKGAS